jgi:hypothetical protein
MEEQCALCWLNVVNEFSPYTIFLISKYFILGTLFSTLKLQLLCPKRMSLSSCFSNKNNFYNISSLCSTFQFFTIVYISIVVLFCVIYDSCINQYILLWYQKCTCLLKLVLYLQCTATCDGKPCGHPRGYKIQRIYVKKYIMKLQLYKNVRTNAHV